MHSSVSHRVCCWNPFIVFCVYALLLVLNLVIMSNKKGDSYVIKGLCLTLLWFNVWSYDQLKSMNGTVCADTFTSSQHPANHRSAWCLLWLSAISTAPVQLPRNLWLCRHSCMFWFAQLFSNIHRTAFYVSVPLCFMLCGSSWGKLRAEVSHYVLCFVVVLGES